MGAVAPITGAVAPTIEAATMAGPAEAGPAEAAEVLVEAVSQLGEGATILVEEVDSTRAHSMSSCSKQLAVGSTARQHFTTILAGLARLTWERCSIM